MLNRPLLKTNAKQLMAQTGFKIYFYTLFYMVVTNAINYTVQLKMPNLYYYLSMGTAEELLKYINGLNIVPSLAAVAIAVALVYRVFVAIIEVGYKRTCLMAARGEKIEFRDMFETFGYWVKIICLRIVSGVLVGLGTLCFVIPGIILGFAYSQAEFILIDNPDIGVIEALRRSRQLMQGHKIEFFVFRLSYFLWTLLGSLLIVAYMYVLPYMTVGEALYYEHLCGYRNFTFRQTAPADESEQRGREDQ